MSSLVVDTFKMAAHWLPLLLMLADLKEAYAGRVNTTSQMAVEGNSAAITCSYWLSDDEYLEYVYIDIYVPGRGFVDLVKFYENGTTEYEPYAEFLRNRTTLIMREDAALLQYDEVLCSDFGEYYCNLQTNSSYTYHWMRLMVRGPSAKPSLMLTKQSPCYDDGEDLEAACVGIIGRPSGHFQWYGYRKDNTTIDLTHLADHGPPYRPNLGHCSYKRASHIKFNISADDDGMVLRCVLKDEQSDITSSVDDECGEFCTEAAPVYLKRGPQKPIIASFMKTACPGFKIQAACYGEIGGPSGHFVWYKYKAGQDPVDITSIADPGAPYLMHNSCQYERASMISLTADPADSGMTFRCMVHNHEAGAHGDPAGECGDLCAESNEITIKSSCEAPPSSQPKPEPKPNQKPTSGATTPGAITFLVFAPFVFIAGY